MSSPPILERSEAYPRVLAPPSRVAALRLRPSFLWALAHAAADFVTVAAVGALSYALYLRLGIGFSHYRPEFYAGIHLALAAIIVFALHGRGSYRGHLGLLRIETVRQVLSAVFLGIALVLSLSFFLKLPSFSRLWVLVFAPMAIFALVGQRRVLGTLHAQVRSWNGGELSVLVYGAGETGRLLARQLLEEKALGFRAVGFLDDNHELQGTEVKVGAGVRGERVPVLGSEGDLERVIEETRAGVVFLAMPSAPSSRIAELAARLEARGVPFFFVPGAGDLLFSTLRFGQLGSMPVFTRRRVEAQTLYELLKRLLDVLGAAAALVVASPLLLAGTLLVKLTSPGEVIFRQTRIGRDGRPFTLYKLRTMQTDAPRYGHHPGSPDDPRVTRFGRWLRRTSIDELPQLVNVLRGDMSLVGPRPEMPFIVAQYDDIQRQRLTVPPGVTGLWQISADRAFRIHDNIQYDLYYVEHRSLALDLAILMLTPFVLLGRESAM